MPELNSKVAAITGASSGIGAVYADRLARRGHDLVLVARRADRLEALAELLSARYGRHIDVLPADLEKQSDLERVAEVLAARTDIHMLVNNAGLARFAPMTTALLHDVTAQIALNITALTRLTRAVLPGFASRDSGVIVNIASVLGIETLDNSAVYSGTKGFVFNFTRSLQKEFAGTGIAIQLVLPAATATDVWSSSGRPLDTLDPRTVMTAENCVDAALAGLDSGEGVTWPSVADIQLWQAYDIDRAALFAASQTGRPAPRYGVA